jgi:hypothetical protein
MADSWSILGGLSQQHQSEHWPPWRLVETHWVPDLELGPLGVFGWQRSSFCYWTFSCRVQPARASLNATRDRVEPIVAARRALLRTLGSVDTADFASRCGPISCSTPLRRLPLDQTRRLRHWDLASPRTGLPRWLPRACRSARSTSPGLGCYQRRTASTGRRPFGRRHTPFAGRRLLFSRVSDGSFAGGCLPACRVRRRRGVRLQPQHHRDLVLALVEVGAACRAVVRNPKVISKLIARALSVATQ